MPSILERAFQREDVNFLLTNRIPRIAATRFMNWFSRIEVGWIRDLSIRTWSRFDRELELDEAKHRNFKSLNDCFTRELKPGARPIDSDPDVVVSPCDAIVGAHGGIDGTRLIQTKGLTYTLLDLLGDQSLVDRHRDGLFVTLRLKGSMYHRFHAPCDCSVSRVTYISGDTWNVNPIALKRVERLYCRNERAVMPLEARGIDGDITLVPVAAVLVASMRIHCVDGVLDLRYQGPNHMVCSASYSKGDELGYFEQGSTIIVFASGALDLCENVVEGARIRMGEPLLRTRVSSAVGNSPKSAAGSRR